MNNKQPKLAYLIESELEKAELILATKSITEKIQSMAENLAKVEANDVMPLLDQLRNAFGASAADKFNSTVTSKVRELLDVIKSAKDAIDNDISNLENIASGGNDMSTEMPEQPEVPEEEPIDNTEQELPPELSSENEPNEQPEVPEEEPLNPNGSAGRTKKESKQYTLKNSMSIFRETMKPNIVVLNAFRKYLKESQNTFKAVKMTATRFDIEPSDVAYMVKESCKKKINDTKTKKVKETFDMRPTPKSKKGMFDNETIADLRKKLASVKKEMDSYKEKGKTVPKELRSKFSQLTFAIRAKQKDKWGKVNEDEVNDSLQDPTLLDKEDNEKQDNIEQNDMPGKIVKNVPANTAQLGINKNNGSNMSNKTINKIGTIKPINPSTNNK